MIDYDAMAEQLHGEYRTIFEKAELFSDINGIEEEIKADRLMNLLDLLTAAEADQKPTVTIIGSDLEKFCKEYFSEEEAKNKIKKIPEKIYTISCGLLAVLLLDILFLEHPSQNILTMKSDILPMVSGILTGGLVVIVMKYFIGPIIYRSKKIPSIVYYILTVLLFIGSIVAAVSIIGERDLSLPSFPFLAFSVSYIVIYLTVRSVLRYQKTGSIRKPKLSVDPDYEFHFLHPDQSNNFSNDLKEATQKGLVKRFQRINKKRKRRNQTAMTTQEFIQKARKEDAIVNPICIWGLGIAYIIMGTATVVSEIHGSGIGLGSLLLLAIISAIYIPLFLFIRYFILLGARYRSQILSSWESQGITILEEKQDDKS